MKLNQLLRGIMSNTPYLIDLVINVYSFVMFYFVLFCFYSYEQADTHQFEVVRMLLNDPDELEEYVLTSQDK